MPYLFSVPEWMDDYRMRGDDQGRRTSRFGRLMQALARRCGRTLGEWRRPPRAAAAIATSEA